MEKLEPILEYKGELTFNTIGRLLTLLKHRMVEKGIKLGVYKRILSVMIEALENIYKYSSHYSGKKNIIKNFAPTFSLHRLDHKYIIKTSNPIKNIHIPTLKAKIDLINSKTHDDLRLYYRQTIMDGKFTDKGGAGLGLIEMAKITNSTIDYSFVSIDEEYSVYNLSLTFC